jgi:hypothetical protein
VLFAGDGMRHCQKGQRGKDRSTTSGHSVTS